MRKSVEAEKIVRRPSHILRGEATRARVLESAVQIATLEGLEALTIGRMAKVAKISKAGLLGHFKSKERLQLATLAAGRRRFFEAVVSPLRSDEEGILRLAGLIERALNYISNTKGGCFFVAVAAEFDGREGPVRDSVAAIIREWRSTLAKVADQAKELGHIIKGLDTRELAFALHAYELAMNLDLHLLGDTKAKINARKFVRDLLISACTPVGRRLLTRKG
jgi:AcrR family transcriptional regulator